MADRDADYYQAHKDDPEEWGDPRGSPAPPARLPLARAQDEVRLPVPPFRW